MTKAPLRGMRLGRENGRVLVWDSARNVAVLDLSGRTLAAWAAPEPIRSADWADGTPVAAVLTEDGRLWWFEPSGQVASGPSIEAPLAVAVDPFGHYAAVSSTLGETRLLDRWGRPVGRLTTRRPVSRLLFLHSEPNWIGAADHGLLGCYTLQGGVVWQENLLSNVGALAATDDGGTVLIACFGQGIQRFDWEGSPEGAYHVGTAVSRVTCTEDGSRIAAATLERQLLLLDRSGRVLWDAPLKEPPLELAIDALGRYLIVGQPSGRVVFWRLVSEDGAKPPEPAAQSELLVGPRGGRQRTAATYIREADWLAHVGTREEAESARLALLDRPARIGLFTSRRRLEVFDPTLPVAEQRSPETEGAAPNEPEHPRFAQPIHTSEVLLGRGRLLRGGVGVLVAATDRRLLVYEADSNTSRFLPARFEQITHLLVVPSGCLVAGTGSAARKTKGPAGRDFQIVQVEDRERLGALSSSGKVLWTRQLAVPVQDAAVADGHIALTTDDGSLVVYDGAGELSGR
ncbi:MAG: PQQ-binding-like beta-propeller repeat protein, partial [Pirellulales bacterium]